MRQSGMKRVADKQIDVGLKARGFIGIDVDVLHPAILHGRPPSLTRW